MKFRSSSFLLIMLFSICYLQGSYDSQKFDDVLIIQASQLTVVPKNSCELERYAQKKLEREIQEIKEIFYKKSAEREKEKDSLHQCINKLCALQRAESSNKAAILKAELKRMRKNELLSRSDIIDYEKIVTPAKWCGEECCMDKDGYGFPFETYWCCRPASVSNEKVQELISPVNNLLSRKIEKLNQEDSKARAQLKKEGIDVSAITIVHPVMSFLIVDRE